MNKEQLTYSAPSLEAYAMSDTTHLLSALSLAGDLKDYDEGGDYDGVYSSTPV